MGLLDAFRRQPAPAASLNTEMLNWVFPGGRQEMESKGKIVSELSHGKLNTSDGSLVCFHTKLQFKIAHTKFDGLNHLGPNFETLRKTAETASKRRLNEGEVISIVHYAVFDSVDTSKDTRAKILTFFTGLYGSNDLGCDADEIPGAGGDANVENSEPCKSDHIATKGSSAIKFILLVIKSGCFIIFVRSIVSLVCCYRNFPAANQKNAKLPACQPFFVKISITRNLLIANCRGGF